MLPIDTLAFVKTECQIIWISDEAQSIAGPRLEKGIIGFENWPLAGQWLQDQVQKTHLS